MQTLYSRLFDGAFGLSADMVSLTLQDVSFVPGADLTEWGFAPYVETERPSAGPGQQAAEVAPVGGVQQWAVIDVPEPVPAEVWSYQAQIIMKLTPLGSLGLDGAVVGLTEGATVWDAVLAAVAALEPQPRLVAETQLASAPGFRRDSLLIAQLGPVLGLTDEMIDNMFIAAKAIP